MILKFLIPVVFLFSFNVYSQKEKAVFSLEDAIEYALKNNRQVKNAALDIKAAKKQKWETIATGLPQINAKIDYQNWLKQQVSLLPAEIFGGEEGTFTEIAFGTKQNMTASATLSQLIFDGSYIVGLQSAKVFLEISKNAKEKTDLEIRKAVINAYGNVLLTQESITILNKNISVLEKNVFETRKIYENGLTEQENVEQLQITLAGLKSNLNNITRLNDLAYKMLNITLGIDLNSEIQLTDSLEVLTQKNINLELLNDGNNVNNNIDYKIAINDKTSKELLLRLEKSKALPKLTAFINGGYNANSNHFTFTNSDQKWFGSSLLGVSLNLPIFSSGMRSASTQRAKINLEKSKEVLTETEQKLQLQIASAKSDYQFAIEDFENKKENLRLAERIEQKNQTKFFEGINTSFDLRQAQTQLFTSQNDLLKAMLNVITKKAALETVLNKPNTK